ncbi:MAG TPA: glutamine amidotransferase [Sphaerochaeta sp.]|nr:glutamine amidotransferase [Sphaerochaeta sp.]
MKKIRVLLAGESWVTFSTHHKGFDRFAAGMYDNGQRYLEAALKSDPSIEYVHMPGHEVSERFPFTMEELNEWDVIIISDIGSNSFLLSNKVFLEGRKQVNRLQLLKEWTSAGGALVMCGGYLSFSGFQASAKFFRTPIEEVLPVDIYTFDDRVETPEGTEITIVDPDHPILDGIKGPWPHLLGYQEAPLKGDAHLIAQSQYGHPLIAVRKYGKGTSMVWMSDIGPHWCPLEFTRWEGYATFWRNAIHYLANDR